MELDLLYYAPKTIWNRRGKDVPLEVSAYLNYLVLKSPLSKKRIFRFTEFLSFKVHMSLPIEEYPSSGVFLYLNSREKIGAD
mgnify:CR=1 FL=1